MKEVTFVTQSGMVTIPSRMFHFTTVTEVTPALSPSQLEMKLIRDNHDLMKDIPHLLSGELQNYLSTQLKSRRHLFEVIDYMQDYGDTLGLSVVVTNITPVEDGRRFTDIRSYSLAQVLSYALDEITNVPPQGYHYSTRPKKTTISKKRRERKRRGHLL